MFGMNDLALTVLIWVGVAAIAALIWLVIEAALTVRSARNTITELSERVEPTLAHVEQITESLKPAIDRLDPLIERASLTVDSVNLELMQIDKILSDTSNITGTASGAVQKISDVANAPANLASEAADKLKGVFGKKKKEKKVKNACKPNDTAALEAVTGNDAAAKNPAKTSKLVDDWSKETTKAKDNKVSKDNVPDEKKDTTTKNTNTNQSKKNSTIEYSVVSIDDSDEDLDIDEPTNGSKEKTQAQPTSSQPAQTAQSAPVVPAQTTQTKSAPTQPAQPAPTQPQQPQTTKSDLSNQLDYTGQTKEERIKEIDDMLNNSSFFK